MTGTDEVRLRPARTGWGVLPARWTAALPEGDPGDLPSSRPLAATLTAEIALRERETTMVALPLFRPWGLLRPTLALRLASTFVLRQRSDPPETLRSVARQRASATAVLPAVLDGIAALPTAMIARLELQRLRVIGVSSPTLPSEVTTKTAKAHGAFLYKLSARGTVRFGRAYGNQELPPT
jgi:acyl-CoA synthetase (AMP-forming)/AMP-acid ligase II